MDRFLAVSTVKNEAAFLLEWLAWCRLVGFTDFYICQNDSTDGTKEMLSLLRANGLIHYGDNDGHNYASPQRYSFRRAVQSEVYAQADWVMALDVDEFVNISAGRGTLADLVAAMPDTANEIRLCWRNFGHAGQTLIEDELVVERFDKCVGPDRLKVGKFPTKTLYRREVYPQIGVHKPRAEAIHVDNVYDGSGNRVALEQTKEIGLLNPDPAPLGCIHHYIVKDISNYVLKCHRGKAGHVNREMKARFWQYWNVNDVRNSEMSSQAERIRAEIDVMDRLCGGQLKPLHAQGVEWRKKTLAAILQKDEYSQILQEICALEETPVPHIEAPSQPDQAPAEEASGPSFDFSLMQRLAEEEGGEFHETAHHAIVFLPGKDRLICSFDNLSWTRQATDRIPWSFELVRKLGWGMLGVMCKESEWYQCPELIACLEGMRDRGVFTSHPQVSMYGASMGAFAACTFARLAPGCTVVAFSPQSTLASDLAPFENRYRAARNRYDWSQGAYRDGAEGLRAAGKAYVVHDPTISQDRAHAERLLEAGAIDLRWPYLSHKVPPTFKRMQILKPIAIESLSGTMTRARFTQLMRARRTAIPYTLRMIEGAVARGHVSLARAALARARVMKDNWKLRKLAKHIEAMNQPEERKAAE